MASVWYATREEVKGALDTKETARNNAQVDRAIAASSQSIEEDQLFRRFYPLKATRVFDWPECKDPDIDRWRVPLGKSELITATTVTVSGTVTTSFVLHPANEGPPYTELVFDSDVSGPTGSDRYRAVSVTGVFGHRVDDAPAGALAAAIGTTAVTTCTVTDSAVIGVGQLLLIGTERLIVTEKSMVDTGVDIAAGDSLTAQAADVSVTLSTATSAPVVGETILIDSERMLVVDVAGLVLTLKRAWDGSALAAHAAGASIWAPRGLTVERGVLGTTAATHLTAAAISKHRWPALVNELAVAESMNQILQEISGYGRAVSEALADVRQRAWIALGRKVF